MWGPAQPAGPFPQFSVYSRRMPAPGYQRMESPGYRGRPQRPFKRQQQQEYRPKLMASRLPSSVSEELRFTLTGFVEAKKELTSRMASGTGGPIRDSEVSQLVAEVFAEFLERAKKIEPTLRNTVSQKLNMNYELNGSKMSAFEDVSCSLLSTSKPFGCDVCSKYFRSPLQAMEHLSEHRRCSLCPVVAHPKVIAKHVEMTHLTGLDVRLQTLDSPEDIAKWKEERKKNYPTAERQAVQPPRDMSMLNKRSHGAGWGRKEREHYYTGPKRYKSMNAPFGLRSVVFDSDHPMASQDQQVFQQQNGGPPSKKRRKNKVPKWLFKVLPEECVSLDEVDRGIPNFAGTAGHAFEDRSKWDPQIAVLFPRSEDQTAGAGTVTHISDSDEEGQTKVPRTRRNKWKKKSRKKRKEEGDCEQIPDDGGQQRQHGEDALASKSPSRRKWSERLLEVDDAYPALSLPPAGKRKLRSRSVLEGLLHKEIRQERVLLYQVIRYIVQENFFDGDKKECPSTAPKEDSNGSEACEPTIGPNES
ncbi:unnamed protein product [Cyprideis torosa]|uniref:Uncharacterized protein n=1 Tax=Cyprideis torosa TaxID=163714 RepID=A0A7R8WI90_9CRUS|nr:unnamed protein product [Cyprideis torosa]CAG0894804.1 unnamed protein product [Cyprideis torosa]